MSRPFYTVLLLAAAPLAWAQSACEQAFISHGDPRNGATYMTKVRLPGLEPAMAVDQLRLSAGQQGLEVGGQRVDGNQHQQFLCWLLPSPMVRSACCSACRATGRSSRQASAA